MSSPHEPTSPLKNPAPAQFKDHFSGVARGYSEFRPRYPAALFQWLASIVPGKHRAWDCATGNGQAALGLAAHFNEVIATDASSGQIAGGLPHPAIQYRVASAEDSGLAENSVDLVTVAQAVHWFDRPKFYAEARRILRPNGCIALWCYATMTFGIPAIDRLLDTFYSQTVGPFWPPERTHIEEHYRSIEFPFDEIFAPSFQMEAAFTLDTLAGYLRTWSATQRYIQARHTDPVTTLLEQLRPHWPDSNRPRNPAWPIFLRVGKVS